MLIIRSEMENPGSNEVELQLDVIQKENSISNNTKDYPLVHTSLRKLPRCLLGGGGGIRLWQALWALLYIMAKQPLATVENK